MDEIKSGATDKRMADPVVRRPVRISMDPDAYGQPWSVLCDWCPMKIHTDALGQPAPICAAGLMTNVQGAVPLKQCKHYQRDSIKSEGETLTVACSFSPNPGPERGRTNSNQQNEVTT